MAAVLPFVPLISAGLGIYGAINNAAQAAAARRQQQQVQAQQQAVQNRQTIAAENQAATLDQQSANLNAAVAAGRRGQGGLAYSGAFTGLKTTFGG